MGSDSRYETLGEIFEGALRSFGPNELFGTKVAGQWRWTTYREFGDLVDRLRGGLVSLGVERGDRVAIVSNNRLEWAVTAFACYTLGAVFVPMYEAQSPKEWQFIISECEAKTLFVANEASFVKARPLLDTIPPLRALVLLSGSHDGAGGSHAGDGKRVAMYSELLDAPAVARTTAAPDDTAVLIYTSGTTGAPKGVVLTNRNIASNVSAIHAVFQFGTSDRSLAFLPWAHVFGQTAELYLLMSFGASMALCEGPDKILDNLAEVKPTLLFSVPRVFNRIYLAVQQQLAVKPRAVQKLVSLALAIAARERDGRTPKVHERLLRALVDRVVFEKVRARFGGRLRFAVSGSAALSMEVAQFVDSLGILVYEGYGLTETSPVVSVNVPGARRMGTVGRVLPGVRVVIDPTSVQDGGNGKTAQREGEIVVFGPNVMKGYFKREAETAAVVTPDGGFRTGDMGCVDADGYLSITGRIKEQYKLENGKYVVPSPLEEELKLSPYVSNVMIYGDNRPFNVALVVANLPAVTKWAEDERISLPTDPSAVLTDSRVRTLFEREIKRCGATFKGYEAVADFALIPTDFTVDNDMLTPKMSLKRRRVLEVYGSLIDSLYAKRRDRFAATVSQN